jgi:hypothetical protein
MDTATLLPPHISMAISTLANSSSTSSSSSSLGVVPSLSLWVTVSVVPQRRPQQGQRT